MFVFNSHAVAAFPPLEHFRSPARPVMVFRFWMPPHLPSPIQGLSVRQVVRTGFTSH